MRHKHLESALTSIQREFPNPDITLEQYPTSPSLAASVALTAQTHGHIGPGRSVVDLGCGTGMLAMAAALLKSDQVIAIDCDARALNIARENANILDLHGETIEFIMAKVKSTYTKEAVTSVKQGHQRHRGKGRQFGRNGKGRSQQQSTAPTLESLATNPLPALNDSFTDDGVHMRSKCVDTVICNPPFGTKNNAGMDVRFLQTAVRLARLAVYSFHKTTTRAYLQRLVNDEWNLQFTVVAEMQFDIDRIYKFHKDKTRDVAVDLIRIDIAVLPVDVDDQSRGDGDDDASIDKDDDYGK
ncbi:hypothetical protein MPSEU_000896500 [Mayamaea pseudoterrestris]|nr:hypothetical protein MPSEU_000896500 [Mayamaea pseudoterrestris]